MVVRKDIVELSIPFSFGVAVAAVVNPDPEASYATAFAVSVAAAGLLALAAHRHEGTDCLVSLLFLALGSLCWETERLCGGIGWTAEFTKAWLADLTALIDNAGFSHAQTPALLKALLTGDRAMLDHATISAFRKSGASHILALSGLHLGIIYTCVRTPLAILGNSRTAFAARSVATVSICAFYTLMTGASPSTVRALLFISINEFSALSPSRRRDPLAILCTALMIQLCMSPSVITSVGFQLSYLAILGIFLISPVLQGFYPPGSRWDPARKIWNATALTLSCQIFTAPLVWLHFHTFPKHFLLTNIIALPVTEFLMVSAVAVLLMSAVGLCPEILKAPVDFFAEALIFCLKVISEM